MKKEKKQDKRAAALRANLRRRKDKVKAVKEDNRHCEECNDETIQKSKKRTGLLRGACPREGGGSQ